MKVTLLASTAIHLTKDWEFPAEEYLSWNVEGEGGASTEAEYLTTFAGRSCYRSWNRPNPSTSFDDEYVKSIISKKHFSVLEHASATFFIEDVSRALTHELVRHRHFSFSQLSQRFVDVSHDDVVIPPAIRGDNNLTGKVLAAHTHAVEAYEELVADLQANGYSRKQAREAARSVLPNAQTTDIVVTGNHRAWREFLEKRLSPQADAEIRELANDLLSDLYELAPSIYQEYMPDGAE